MKITTLFPALIILLILGVYGFSQGQKDVYAVPGLSFSVDKRRLVEAAEQLRADPTKVIYLVAYNKTGQRKSTAVDRLNKSKKFLVRKLGISMDRIRTVYGGTKEQGLVMEIFITKDDKGARLSKSMETCSQNRHNRKCQTNAEDLRGHPGPAVQDRNLQLGRKYCLFDGRQFLQWTQSGCLDEAIFRYNFGFISGCDDEL
jgi:hypothetical protein